MSQQSVVGSSAVDAIRGPVESVGTCSSTPLVQAVALTDAARRFTQSLPQSPGAKWSDASQLFAVRLMDSVTRHAVAVAQWWLRLGSVLTADDRSVVNVLRVDHLPGVGTAALSEGSRPRGTAAAATATPPGAFVFANALAAMLRTPVADGTDVIPALVTLTLGRGLWLQRMYADAAVLLWEHGVEALLTLPPSEVEAHERGGYSGCYGAEVLRRLIIMSGMPTGVSQQEVLRRVLAMWTTCVDTEAARGRLQESEAMLRHVLPDFSADAWLSEHVTPWNLDRRPHDGADGGAVVSQRSERRKQVLNAAKDHCLYQPPTATPQVPGRIDGAVAELHTNHPPVPVCLPTGRSPPGPHSSHLQPHAVALRWWSGVVERVTASITWNRNRHSRRAGAVLGGVSLLVVVITVVALCLRYWRRGRTGRMLGAAAAAPAGSRRSALDIL